MVMYYKFLYEFTGTHLYFMRQFWDQLLLCVVYVSFWQKSAVLVIKL